MFLSAEAKGIAEQRATVRPPYLPDPPLKPLISEERRMFYLEINQIDKKFDLVTLEAAETQKSGHFVNER
jgi:hypothetical protein